MSSESPQTDDNIAVEGSTTLTKEDNGDKTQTERGNIDTKTQETTKVTHEALKGEPDVWLKPAGSSENSSTEIHSGGSQIEENEDVPTTSVTTEEVDSQRPTNPPDGSANAKTLTKKTSNTGRILLKRRSSRLSTPTVDGSRNLAEEVDSGPPRSSKRRSQKKRMIALFLESDYPRKK